MNKQSAIIFASKNNSPEPDYEKVPVYGPDGKHVGNSFIRSIIVNGDVDDALNKAPEFQRDGEVILNTVPFKGDTGSEIHYTPVLKEAIQ